MTDVSSFQWLLAALSAWLNRQPEEVVAYVVEENRVLRAELGGRRLRLTDDDRRRLAARGHSLGRRTLRQGASIVTPDPMLRWHRRLMARKWTSPGGRRGRAGVVREIRPLVGCMARENPTWGYSRIRGALQNLGHRVARSTMAAILKEQGIPPVPERPTSWRPFLRSHWGAIVGADFFTTEGWTWRGLVTYYTLFAIDLASRRVHILGSTAHPDDAFMLQVVRAATAADEGALVGHRALICDRDAKWSVAVRHLLDASGIRVVRTPVRAPNAHAHAERFVRSIKEECLNRIIPFGEGRLRRAIGEFVEHYHRERNHQGLGNELIDGQASVFTGRVGAIRRRQRLGGLLSYDSRAA